MLASAQRLHLDLLAEPRLDDDDAETGMYCKFQFMEEAPSPDVDHHWFRIAHSSTLMSDRSLSSSWTRRRKPCPVNCSVDRLKSSSEYHSGPVSSRESLQAEGPCPAGTARLEHLLARQTTGYAEAPVVVPARRRVRVAERRPARDRAEPTPPPGSPLPRTCRIHIGALLVVVPIKPVLAPFPHIAVHVVQAPGIWRLLTHGMRRPSALALNHACSFNAASSSVPVPRRRCPGPAGVLPLGLGRQPIHRAGRLLLRQFAQLAAERRCLVPIDFSTGRVGSPLNLLGLLPITRSYSACVTSHSPR